MTWVLLGAGLLVVGVLGVGAALLLPGLLEPGPTTVAAVDEATRRQVTDDVDALADELDAWWDAELRGVTDDVPEPRLADGGGLLRCDGETIVLDDELVDNAWVGECREGLTIAYDPALFAGDRLELEMTMAHEWGHVVQFTTPSLDVGLLDGGLPVDSELQADCFAGAWYADARPDGPVELALRSVRATGDLPDTPRDDPDAHGSPDERADAFLEGHRDGVEACLR